MVIGLYSLLDEGIKMKAVIHIFEAIALGTMYPQTVERKGIAGVG